MNVECFNSKRKPVAPKWEATGEEMARCCELVSFLVCVDALHYNHLEGLYGEIDGSIYIQFCIGDAVFVVEHSGAHMRLVHIFTEHLARLFLCQ